MSCSRGAAALRATAVVAFCGFVELLLWRLVLELATPAGQALTAPVSGVRAVADLVTAVAAVLLALGWTWLSCAAALTATDLLRRGTTRRRLAVPPGWHRLVAGLLGAGALCLPVGAHADVPGEDPVRDGSSPAATAIDGLPLPDRPRGAGARVPPASHRVADGDSLWSLTREHLGGGASDARVACTWPRWYAANIDVIGPDPDLLIPGTVLRAPKADSGSPPPAGTDPARDDGGQP
jgi:nucleoid-associated protein YgaU